MDKMNQQNPTKFDLTKLSVEQRNQCVFCKQEHPDVAEYTEVGAGHKEDIGRNKEGKVLCISIPERRFVMPACSQCTNKLKGHIAKMRLLYIPLGLLLLVGTIGALIGAGYMIFGGKLWIDMGVGNIQAMPFIAIIIVLIPFIILLVLTIKILRRGFGKTMMLAHSDINDKAQQLVAKELTAIADNQMKKRLFTFDVTKWNVLEKENENNQANAIKPL